MAEPGPHAAASAAGDVDLEWTLMVVSSAVAVGGIGLAMVFFLRRRDLADRVSRRLVRVHRLLQNKYYVDECYDAVIVRPIRLFSEHGLWHAFDEGVVDRGVNGVGTVVSGVASGLRRLQTGSVRSYAASLFLGVILVLGYYVWR
jgi:NADH-quinone oxidoreductase subunit L